MKIFDGRAIIYYLFCALQASIFGLIFYNLLKKIINNKIIRIFSVTIFVILMRSTVTQSYNTLVIILLFLALYIYLKNIENHKKYYDYLIGILLRINCGK